MTKVSFLVTSKNSLKVEAVRSILSRVFPSNCDLVVSGVSADSGVSEQPTSLEETRRGAVNRINNTTEEADYFVSVESGIEKEFDSFYSFTFCAVCDRKKIKFGFGTSSKFLVPEFISKKILKDGCTLGSALHNEEGLIAALTGGIMTRTQLVSESLVTALIPFHFYKSEIPKDVPPECLKYADANLSDFEKNGLFAQLRGLDFKPVADWVKGSLQSLEVAEVSRFEDEFEDIYANGVEAIRAGEVAVVILAGGQGSRLGSPIPKALVQLDTPSNYTLLEIQLRKVKKLLSLFSQYNQKPQAIPVYILTSEDTHSAIAAYLIAKQNFDVPHVRLVMQENLPARLPDGSIAMKTKCQVLSSPNGNGSLFETLLLSGALAEMEKMGVKYVECHPIDNCLAKPSDPAFIGSMIYEGADAALKVVRKASPEERIGTVCRRGGKNVVVEYSEIPPEDAKNHMYGSTALLAFTIELVRKAAKANLPFHRAIKKENTVNGTVEVHKFERFNFDALELSENTTLMEVNREEEFAPVKNASGASTDTPETARDIYLALHRKWAEDAEIILEGDGAFEIRPELSYAGEGLERYSNMKIGLPILL